jgi:hypothetical protein
MKSFTKQKIGIADMPLTVGVGKQFFNTHD